MSKKCKTCDMKCETMCSRTWEPLDGLSYNLDLAVLAIVVALVVWWLI